VTDRRHLTRAETLEAAELLRRLLRTVESGELDADDPASRAVLRHLRGAATALSMAAGLPAERAEKPPLHETEV